MLYIQLILNPHSVPMADRPPPPTGSQSLDLYNEGARVYYYRSGNEAAGTMAVQVRLTRGTVSAGKWRLGQIRKPESSGKRYVVSYNQSVETHIRSHGKKRCLTFRARKRIQQISAK